MPIFKYGFRLKIPAMNFTNSAAQPLTTINFRVYLLHKSNTMKKILLLSAVFSAAGAMAQQTIHSTGNGSVSNPLNWDCFCFPTPDDYVYVDHQMTMDVDWAITSGGKIEIAAGASLTQDQDRQLLVDGTGSLLINNGTANFTDIAFTNGSGGTNANHFAIDRALYFGGTTTFANTGTIVGLDSLMTEGTFLNTGNCTVGNFLNTGTFSNDGQIVADSVGNTGDFLIAGGHMTISTFGNSGTFTMNLGYIDVMDNWYNAGDYSINGNANVYVGGNAYTGDTLGGSALLTVNGTMSVTGDFGSSDDVNGSGWICMGGYSANAGTWSGTFDFCDATGGNVDLNVGTIGGGITFCTNGCSLGMEENGGVAVTLYPNPASGKLFIESGAAFETAEFCSLAGEKVLSASVNGNAIALDGLQAGVYFIKLIGETAVQPLRVVIE